MVKGRIFSGRSEGKNYISLSWVKEQIIEKMGFTPYGGTLNIMLFKDDDAVQRLQNAEGVDIVPATGFFAGKLFRASVHNVNCAVVIPQTLDYPEYMLEVISPENLRRKLHVRDGDIIELTVVL